MNKKDQKKIIVHDVYGKQETYEVLDWDFIDEFLYLVFNDYEMYIKKSEITKLEVHY